MPSNEGYGEINDNGAAARWLVSSAATATLAILLPLDAAAPGDDTSTGGPYASLVLVATAHNGASLLLLLSLAEHTRALWVDPRRSLLFDGTGDGWGMTGVDAEGFGLFRAGQIACLSFESPIYHAADARRALVDLAGKAQNPPA